MPTYQIGINKHSRLNHSTLFKICLEGRAENPPSSSPLGSLRLLTSNGKKEGNVFSRLTLRN